mmetsp:Transcript_528/g.1241  ORF Transcript_528/g.1241 Transcript_528/m.1241 type:complete len:159 (-) Transcript_528:8-484(-)
MKNFNQKITVNDVYSHVIDVTVESLSKYLKKSKGDLTSFDLPKELKSRWKARMGCLLNSLNDSWLKFQDNSMNFQGYKKKNHSSMDSRSLLHFPLVCMLSWDFFRQSHLEGGKVSGFKSWVWNCLISRVVAEGVYPSQSIVKNPFNMEKIGTIRRKKS